MGTRGRWDRLQSGVYRLKAFYSDPRLCVTVEPFGRHARTNQPRYTFRITRVDLTASQLRDIGIEYGSLVPVYARSKTERRWSLGVAQGKALAAMRSEVWLEKLGLDPMPSSDPSLQSETPSEEVDEQAA